MNLNRLNINVNGTPASGFVGGTELFDNVAARVGAGLPSEYIDFIREVDGGHPEVGTFFLQGETANSFSVDWFYTFSNPDIENVNAALDGWSKILGSRILPIGRDAGGGQFCLKLGDVISSVWLYRYDETLVKIKLADSLAEFLTALAINPDFI